LSTSCLAIKNTLAEYTRIDKKAKTNIAVIEVTNEAVRKVNIYIIIAAIICL
jgi:hypothetical protein